MHLAHRMSKLGGEAAFVTLAAAKQLEAAGKHVIHLEIGQPDFDTPSHIVEAARKALQDGETRYTPSAGLPELREAVAEYMVTRRVKATGANVVITPGAKSALYSAMVGLIEEGTDVLMPDPGFPAYASIASYLGARPIYYGLDDNNGFSVSASELESKLTPNTKVVILNYPHNPSGGSITDKDLKEIAELAVRKDLYVIADEIYAELQYSGGFYSIQSLPGMAERTIIVDGFSKSYAMTGWRLGWIVLPEHLSGDMSTLATNTFSCAASFIQRAGIAALRGPQDCVRDMCKEYEARARIVTDLLNTIPGVKCALPRGAFYAFPDVRGILEGRKSAELAHELLYNHGVALLPGTAFGESGEGFLRVSYANSRENIVEGIRRVTEGIGALV